MTTLLYTILQIFFYIHTTDTALLRRTTGSGTSPSKMAPKQHFMWGKRRPSLQHIYHMAQRLVPLVPSLRPFLEPYLPVSDGSRCSQLPFVTLTYAASVDSRIALAKGVQTVISHEETKTMTHYLRSKHDAILVGSGTVISDDPGLNCRFTGDGGSNVSMIRPVVVDKNFDWNINEGSRIVCTARRKEGLGPFVIVGQGASSRYPEKVDEVKSAGGEVFELSLNECGRFSWSQVMNLLLDQGIKSVMVEGGASIINDLLLSGSLLVDSLIVTIGPVYLGRGGVEVSPLEHVELKSVDWWKGTRDSILAAKLS